VFLIDQQRRDAEDDPRPPVGEIEGVADPERFLDQHILAGLPVRRQHPPEARTIEVVRNAEQLAGRWSFVRHTPATAAPVKWFTGSARAPRSRAGGTVSRLYPPQRTPLRRFRLT